MGQIIIGTAIVFVLTIIAAVFHKKGRLIWITEACCMGAVTVFGLVCLIRGTAPVNPDNGTYFSDKSSESKKAGDETEEGYFDIVKLIAQAGNLDSAKSLLSECAEEVDYNEDYLKTAGELYKLDGETDRAQIIRNAVGSSFASIGEGLTDNKDAKIAAEAFLAVGVLVEVDSGNAYIYDDDELREYFKSLKAWADTDYAYSDLPTMKKAKLSSELLLHDYKEITDDVSDDADGEGLIIASRLVREGKVEDKKVGFGSGNDEDKSAITVLTYIDSESQNDDSYSEEELEYLKSLGDDIYKAVIGRDSLSGYIKNKLRDAALSDSAMASKIYLELADIAYAEGDREEAVEYLEKCLRSAAQSSDAEYAAIVDEINDILFRTDDPEERKYLSDYVRRMQENRLPEELPDIDSNVFDGITDYSDRDDTTESDIDSDYNFNGNTGVDIWNNTEESTSNQFIDDAMNNGNNNNPGVDIWNNTEESTSNQFIDDAMNNGNNNNPGVDIWNNTEESTSNQFIDDAMNNGNNNNPGVDIWNNTEESTNNPIIDDAINNNNNYHDDDYNDYNDNYDNYDDDYNNNYDNYDNDDEYNNNGSDNQPGGSLDDDMTDTLNQMAGSISIISVDKEAFPNKITAVVTSDDVLAKDPDEFKAHMDVTDTDCEITDYTVEKITYDSINVVLVCDDSGSMDGKPRNDLSAAVKAFVENADPSIKIGIVPFASGVKENYVAPLGSSKDKLKETADALCADGGTDIFDAVQYANTMFPDSGSRTLNIMILMSDGQDGAPGPDELDKLHETCVNRNISIYSVGLGNGVDAGLLKQYSSYGNGEYYYVDSSDSITTFYNYIYSISQNRYLVSYEPIDTYRVDRFLEIRYENSPIIFARADYSLFSNDLKDNDNESKLKITFGDVVINGLKEKMIYPSQAPQYLTLIGEEFDKDAKMSIKLSGMDNYECTVEYIDSTSAKVTVPGKIPTGIYDVYVTYNNRRAVFASGLIVSGGDTNVIRFGEYIFTATNVRETGNTVEMSGLVQLNDWLIFNDPVTLTGDRENDYNITMDFGKTTVLFTDTSIGGLSGYYAKKGITASLPVGGKVQIYNDQTKNGTSDDYPVDTMVVGGFYLHDFMKLQGDSAGLKIYPDRAVLDLDAFSSAFPFQGKVLSQIGADDIFRYSLDSDVALTLSKNRVDFKLEINFGNSEKREMTPVKLGNTYMYMNPGDMKFSIDTKSGDVSLKVTANVALLADGVGFEIALKDWKLDKIMLMADKDINTYLGSVPVTLSDFKLGLQDISKVDVTKDWTSLFSMELVGSMDISFAKISAYCKGLEKYVGDVSLFKLDDVTLGFRLKEFRIRAEATAKLLEFVELGHAKIQLGFGLDYENPLFVVQDEPNGAIVEVTVGPKIDEDNFLLELTGTIGLAITDQVIGLSAAGEFHVKLGWWIFVAEERAHGDFFIGWYKQQNGHIAFAVLAHGSASNGKNVSFQLVWGDEDKALSSHKY